MPSGPIAGVDAYVEEATSAFATNLRFIRSKRDMGLEELAFRAGTTYKNAQMIVAGKQGAQLRTIAKLARALHVPVGDLFMDPLKFAKRYEKARPLPPLSDAPAPNGSRKSTPVTEVSPFCKPAAA